MELSFLVDLLVGKTTVCNDLNPIWGLVGWGIFLIKVAVPIILIVVGMADLIKAVMQEKEDDIKKAQKALVTKIATGLAVFLVITLVTWLMTIIGDTSWKTCAGTCIDSPWDSNCKLKLNVKS